MVSFAHTVRGALLSLIVVSSAVASASQPGVDYPMGPRAETTPGALCTHPDSYRYPEHIPYCSRNVMTQEKNAIIAMYDEKFGYHVQQMDRQEFKIDHYIPLCAGGANDATNLWPQHKDVYAITDPLEPLVCNKMAAGKLSQADAVAFIKEGKNDLSKVEGIIDQLNAM